MEDTYEEKLVATLHKAVKVVRLQQDLIHSLQARALLTEQQLEAQTLKCEQAEEEATRLTQLLDEATNEVDKANGNIVRIGHDLQIYHRKFGHLMKQPPQRKEEGES